MPVFYFPPLFVSFSHFPARQPKMTLFKTLNFDYFSPSENDLVRNAHFPCRPFFQDHFSKGYHFHGFAFSDCGESISNLCNDTFAKYLRGIPFCKYFCTGNIFCETVSHFLSRLRIHFPSFTIILATSSRPFRLVTYLIM